MRLKKALCVALVVPVVVSASCEGRPPEYGVNVFSADTVPVVFSITLTGSLALGMQSEGFMVQPDKSLLLSTPAHLAWARGDGTARIKSINGHKLAVQPMGIGADSPSDTAIVEGSVVLLTRPPERRTITLKAEKP